MNETEITLPKVALATEHYVDKVMAETKYEIADAMREQTTCIILAVVGICGAGFIALFAAILLK